MLRQSATKRDVQLEHLRVSARKHSDQITTLQICTHQSAQAGGASQARKVGWSNTEGARLPAKLSKHGILWAMTSQPKTEEEEIPVVKANYDRDTSAPGQRKAVLMVCQVVGCAAPLGEGREYFKRCRICEMHLKLPALMREGQPQRFCQQCCRFHSVKDFEGDRRSCRTALGAHNGRRRKRSHGTSKADDHRHRKRSRRSASGRSNSPADTSQDESDQRFNKSAPLEVPSDMLLPPIGQSGRGPTLRQQHMWAGRVGMPSSWAASHEDFEYDPPAARVRRRTVSPRLLRYQGYGDSSYSNLVPRGFLRKPPPGSNVEIARMGRERVARMLPPSRPSMSHSHSASEIQARPSSRAYVPDPFGDQIPHADDFCYEDFGPMRARGGPLYNPSGRLVKGRQRYMLLGDGVVADEEEGLPLDEPEGESEGSMYFGGGGEEADRHLLIQDSELREYLNEAEKRCSRIARDSLVPILPDQNVHFQRYQVQGGRTVPLPGSPYDSAIDGTEGVWWPPSGRFQDLLNHEEYPTTPEGLQDTSQSQQESLQEGARLPGNDLDGPVMQSAFHAAAQQVFNSPPQPLLPDLLVPSDPEPTPGSLGSKASDEQTVQASLGWSPLKSGPPTLQITPASIHDAPPEATPSSLEQSLKPLQPLSPIGADFFNLFQETGGELQLSSIDDSLLHGLQDLLTPGKSPCEL
ncbi:hypothetical protein WJX84_010686 [Apatococcus fuscideae]|uniref:SBP-type domain-containing protein n=1 Tax=Apatococcus fuscideae TaxID=2026836 RepID=A0AAW1SJ25_9CHLO